MVGLIETILISITFCTVDQIETISVPFGYDDCSCVSFLDQPQASLFSTLIISASPSDVKCPIVFQSNAETCYNIAKECSQFGVFNTTKPFFSFCKNPDNTTEYRMCFGHITEDINGIKLYATKSIRSQSCSGPGPYIFIREYQRAIQLQVEGTQ